MYWPFSKISVPAFTVVKRRGQDFVAGFQELGWLGTFVRDGICMARVASFQSISFALRAVHEITVYRRKMVQYMNARCLNQVTLITFNTVSLKRSLESILI